MTKLCINLVVCYRFIFSGEAFMTDKQGMDTRKKKWDLALARILQLTSMDMIDYF